MPRPFLIIDGYNLMHAAGMTRRTYGPGELEKWRNRFIAFVIGRLSPQERERTTIVFDAGDAPSNLERRSKLDGVTIHFAPAGGDADSVIEHLIAVHSAPRQVHVISSDRRLQRAAQRRRAHAIDAGAFAEELARREESAPKRGPRVPEAKYTGEVSESEVESWLRIFDPSLPEQTRRSELTEEERFWQSRIDELKDEPEE